MKRVFTLVLTFVTVLCMTSCAVPVGSKTSRKNGLSSPFSAAVSITLDRLEAEGSIKRFGEGVWEIEFSEPNTLSGVKLEFSEGSVIASYKGLTFSVPQSAVPVKAMMLNLMKAVDENAKTEELSGKEDGDMLKIEGNLDGGDYALTVDKDGLLSGFDMPNNKLTMRFTEMKTAEISLEQVTTETVTAAVPVTSSVDSQTTVTTTA
ncbi:hypothetical protein [Ruminococcus flavefaciens]|uniref:hypothetical protein n=1 Tax=Ruminococcus flavefaciens TaxID=1265 RepID=UPI0004908D8E|nr:hypothetical protein [Ruminococcus flavefaciens]